MMKGQTIWEREYEQLEKWEEDEEIWIDMSWELNCIAGFNVCAETAEWV